MNTNNTIILSIAGGGIAIVILTLILFNVRGNTSEVKRSNTTQQTDDGYTLREGYDKDFEPNDEVHIATGEVKDYNNDEMDEEMDDMPKVIGGSKTMRKRRSRRTKNKKRKHKKTKHKKTKM
jgi:hypothetical protein